ncbi:MAG: hypothetical protein AVDCRST_MAG93-8564 [uncultured Chloroflexia bacterium]|uniref:Uncharacterized protein n=1 Tax=uncultured Chloroflexia bacterium TaxID=1672391 RepID=A0A6J4N4K6_9CHLR|nr:MAG: hypothetical protein AVDCRST_MAG93-8564 [uncultured Chloroflexia bacterium]
MRRIGRKRQGCCSSIFLLDKAFGIVWDTEAFLVNPQSGGMHSAVMDVGSTRSKPKTQRK